MVFSILLGYSVLESQDFTNFKGDIWLVFFQERYCRENNSILNQLKEQGLCRLSRDGGCDSPRHNANYLTYSFMDQITTKIIATLKTQATEAKKSNNMEKVRFI